MTKLDRAEALLRDALPMVAEIERQRAAQTGGVLMAGHDRLSTSIRAELQTPRHFNSIPRI